MLELDMSALAFMMKCFPEIKEVEDMRKSIGRYGLTGKQQVGKHDVYIATTLKLLCITYMYELKIRNFIVVSSLRHLNSWEYKYKSHQIKIIRRKHFLYKLHRARILIGASL